MDKHSPEILQNRLFYQGRKFSFDVNRLRLPNGVVGEWECIRHPGGALAVPETADGKLILVRQYRFPTQGWMLEFPAGTLEVNETPETTIEREIQEETGYKAGKWQKLGQFFLAPGYSDEIIYAFLATDLEKLISPPSQDEDEDITTVLMSPSEFRTAIENGEDIDSKSISAFFLAEKYL